MKILQISHRIPWPLNEGGTIGIYNYTRGYAEAGHEVTLLALSAKKHNIDMREATEELSKYSRFQYLPIDTDVKPLDALLNLFTKDSYNVTRFYLKEFKDLIEKELVNNNYDLIQVEGTFAAPYTDIVMKHRSGKVILRQHNVEYQIWERLAANTGNPVKKWYLNLLARRLKEFERNNMNMYDAIVPVTKDDGELFRQLGCTKPIFDSPAGINSGLWHPTPEITDHKALYHIGSLEWMPNIDAVEWFLKEVWPLVIRRDEHLRFHIAGKGMPESWKDRKIDGVIMDGQVPDAVEYVQNKGICVVPLRSGSGIRLKILEAMSAGKPVISTTIGAQGIDCTDGENIIVADEPEDMADKIIQLTNHPDRFEQIASNGRKLIEEKYSNVSVIKRLVAFIGTLPAN